MCEELITPTRTKHLSLSPIQRANQKTKSKVNLTKCSCLVGIGEAGFASARRLLLFPSEIIRRSPDAPRRSVILENFIRMLCA